MIQVLTMLSYVLGPPLIALAALALRLRWQALRDRRRQDTLTTLAARLPIGAVIEIRDVRDDGSQLQVRVNTIPGFQAGER